MIPGLGRILVSGLSLSAAGLISIVSYEGYIGKAVIPVKGDVPTLGFGTTSGVKLGDTTTPDIALKRAFQDIEKFENNIKSCVKVPLFQHEYDIYTSFVYNIGTNAFCNSTLVKKLNKEDYVGACNELSRWVYVDGQRISGLVNRRSLEKKQCLGI